MLSLLVVLFSFLWVYFVSDMYRCNYLLLLVFNICIIVKIILVSVSKNNL